MNKSGNKRGESPASLGNLKKPLPAGHDTKVFRVSAPANVLRWFAGLDDAAERGRVLEAAMRAGINGSSVTQESGEWTD